MSTIAHPVFGDKILRGKTWQIFFCIIYIFITRGLENLSQTDIL